MYLIIAEKRSAAEKVGSCIKGESFKKGDGFIQSQNYYITWCAGHLYTLLDLEEYDPNYDPNENISGLWMDFRSVLLVFDTKCPSQREMHRCVPR